MACYFWVIQNWNFAKKLVPNAHNHHHETYITKKKLEGEMNGMQYIKEWWSCLDLIWPRDVVLFVREKTRVLQRGHWSDPKGVSGRFQWTCEKPHRGWSQRGKHRVEVKQWNSPNKLVVSWEYYHHFNGSTLTPFRFSIFKVHQSKPIIYHWKVQEAWKG